MNKPFLPLAVLLLAAAPVLARQDMPTLRGDLKPEVGSWAEYEFDDGKDTGRMKVAVVAKEKDQYWIEQTFKSGRRDEEMAMAMLVGGGGKKPARMLMKTEDGVMDMSGMPFGGPGQTGKDPEFKDLGTETVKTPAGEFKASKKGYKEQAGTGTVWLKAGVGPYGMIKQELKERKSTTRMTLQAYGKGAKPTINPKSAKKMGMSEGMPPGMKGGGDFQEMMRKAMRQAAEAEE